MAGKFQKSRGRCHLFEQTGKCRFGTNCRYSHSTNNSSHPSRKSGFSSGRPETTNDSEDDLSLNEARFREWRFNVPKNQNHVGSITGGLSRFFQTAWDLVKDGEADIQQKVMEKLASEGGLQRINEAISEVTKCPNSQQRHELVEDTFLPVLRIASHADVTNSLIMEQDLAKVHNFFYGPNGKRAVTVFSLATTFLKALPPTSAIKGIAVIATLSCLHQTMEVNTAAKVLQELISVVDDLSDLSFDEMSEAAEARRLLNRVRLRAGLGASLPNADDYHPPSLQANNLPSFNLARDLPGMLSTSGPRHDNDHENIVDIQILPTAGEINATRAEYLPVSDPRGLHLPGLSGLLDKLFRQLREDTVGQLRDAVRLEKQQLCGANTLLRRQAHHQQGVQTFSYRHIQLENILFDRLGGLRAEISFRQPVAVANMNDKLRKQWWEKSKRLTTDALLCLVDASGSASFLCVCDEISKQDQQTPGTRSKAFYLDSKRAIVTVRPVEPHQHDIRRLAESLTGSSDAVRALCEFPGVLLASFHSTLSALQKMSASLDMPFADLIAPPHTTSDVARAQPPVYASSPGFKFNLDSLTRGEPLEFSPRERFDYACLQKKSTLDDAQQTAVVDALSHELALIQGPPGTGKSYTGVALIKALLGNANKAKLGPIVCVCYTNHALDQLLENLIKEGVDQVIRIGSRSKSEILKPLTLREVSHKLENTSVERRKFAISRENVEKEATRIKLKLQNLAQPRRLGAIKYYLSRTSKSHHDQLFGEEEDKEGWQKVDHDKRNPLIKWLQPKQVPPSRPSTSAGRARTRPQLQLVKLFDMSLEERAVLHDHWVDRIREESLRDLQNAFSDIKHDLQILDKCRQEQDLRCLAQAKVIGVTTTGLARNLQLLRHLRSKVLISEEAGEVLEAHLVTAFLPSLEHAILIGDHQQLRPQIQNYELSSENPRGVQYSLDISLFERLIRPGGARPAHQALPFSTLEIQRRMHPSIAQLVKDTLYPRLRDHESVTRYPPVEGIKSRLYWINHDVPENKSESDESTSQSNSHEVEMVAAIVTHLVRQNRYTSEDIAVLTPYQGQFDKIRKRLAQSFEIVIGDKDEEELEKRVSEAENDESVKPLLQKTNLSKAIRLATVDNFQGEEAKVVIVSLVRSNAQRKCGFLKTSNRINVLLSRAQHGMYILGNSETYRHIQMWKEVIQIFEKGNNIGSSLALHCPRHPDKLIEASSPDDFAVKSPEGGCDLMCEWRLNCGHKCITKCHSETRHEATMCLEPCPRSLPRCDHKCPRPCGEACTNCMVRVASVKLPCGHIEDSLACYISQDTSLATCMKGVSHKVPGCGHILDLYCHEGVPGQDFVCKAQCNALLPCGHPCEMECHQCNDKKDGKIAATKHGICIKKCGRNFNTCSHECRTRCHAGVPCDLCLAPCDVACQHSKCKKKCCEPCAPCAQSCTWECPHRGRCPLPCAVPCSLLPCSKRCESKLECGHQCPSVCGEVCPSKKFCQLCGSIEMKQMEVDYIMGATFGETNLDEDPCIVPQCGHIMTMSSMDGHLAISDFYLVSDDGTIIGLKASSQPFSAEHLKNCPKCRGPIRNVNRYNRILRRGLIDEATKKFITWSNTEYIKHADRLQNLQDRLAATTSEALKADSQPGKTVQEGSDSLKLQGKRNSVIEKVLRLPDVRGRYKSILTVRNDISKFCREVEAGEEPFQRIWGLLQDRRRRRQDAIDSDLTLDAHVSQPRSRLLAMSLSLRCDLTILSDALTIRKNTSGLISRYGWGAIELEMDLNLLRNECVSLHNLARDQKQHRVRVEALLYSAHFAALERSNIKGTSTAWIENSAALRDTAQNHLALGRQICINHPNQVRGLADHMDAVETMLRDGTFYTVVTTQEMRAVYTAMSHDFTGTGHWYNCANGHPFTVGECGMPMERARCPQCGSPVGGQDHRPEDGVTRYTELEAEMGNLTL